MDNDQFKKLPKEIRNWLASENLAYAISEITNKIGLSERKSAAISRLIFLLITQQMDPKDFINNLSHELGTSFETAKAIAGDIEKNVLHPMAAELRRELNLDVKSIYFGQPGQQQADYIQTEPEIKPRAAEPVPAESFKRPADSPKGPVVDLQSFSIKSDRPISPLNFASAMKEKTIAAEPKKSGTAEIPPTPFMLHQENPTSAPSINPRPQEFQPAKSSLTMKVQNFYQSSASESDRPVPKPISIKVEMPSSGMNSEKIGQPIQVNRQDAPPAPKQEFTAPAAPAANEEARIVHYSNLRTPINGIGLPKNVVEKDNILDLRKNYQQ